MIALVLGCATSVWEDAEKALTLCKPSCVIVINDMIARWPTPAQHAVTFHPEKMDAWCSARTVAGYPQIETYWSYKPAKGVDRVVRKPGYGSSGLFAARIATEQLKCAVVLAGVPISREAAHIGNPGKPWTQDKSFQGAWRRQVELRSKVRSMSGWTRELLGEPTPEWIADNGGSP